MRQAVALFAIAVFLVAAVFVSRSQNGPIETAVVLEKEYFPKHRAQTSYDVANGEFLVNEDPTEKVYLVQSAFGWVDEQWILKVQATNTSGARVQTFLRVPFDTWITNHPGKPFGGAYFDDHVRWM